MGTETIWLNLTAADVKDEANKPVLIDPEEVTCVRHGTWNNQKCTLVFLRTGQTIAVEESSQRIAELLVLHRQAMEIAEA